MRGFLTASAVLAASVLGLEPEYGNETLHHQQFQSNRDPAFLQDFNAAGVQNYRNAYSFDVEEVSNAYWNVFTHGYHHEAVPLYHQNQADPFGMPDMGFGSEPSSPSQMPVGGGGTGMPSGQMG